jgi:4-oxalocrotonate tautomerase family enzyme
MPLIELTSFGLSADTKRNLVNGLAEKASEITGKPLEYFTVVIREVSGMEAWGHRGKCLG